jgi:hypothetical protein
MRPDTTKMKVVDPPENQDAQNGIPEVARIDPNLWIDSEE